MLSSVSAHEKKSFLLHSDKFYMWKTFQERAGQLQVNTWSPLPIIMKFISTSLGLLFGFAIVLVNVVALGPEHIDPRLLTKGPDGGIHPEEGCDALSNYMLSADNTPQPPHTVTCSRMFEYAFKLIPQASDFKVNFAFD